MNPILLLIKNEKRASNPAHFSFTIDFQCQVGEFCLKLFLPFLPMCICKTVCLYVPIGGVLEGSKWLHFVIEEYLAKRR